MALRFMTTTEEGCTAGTLSQSCASHMNRPISSEDGIAVAGLEQLPDHHVGTQGGRTRMKQRIATKEGLGHEAQSRKVLILVQYLWPKHRLQAGKRHCRRYSCRPLRYRPATATPLRQQSGKATATKASQPKLVAQISTQSDPSQDLHLPLLDCKQFGLPSTAKWISFPSPRPRYPCSTTPHVPPLGASPPLALAPAQARPS